MSAYLKFFELSQSPFDASAQTQVVLGTRALREAFAAILSGLDEGASRICVSGGAGLGKTSLARALPKLLGDAARVALVPDAARSWEACRDALARQWGLEAGRLSRAALVEAARSRRLVLVIDQAENATEEFLDHLDIVLSYRTEQGEPVVQSVLLARLGAVEGEAPAPLLWWLDRLQTLQLAFAPLPRDGVASYVQKHLRRAGWRGERLFSEDATFAIHGYTGGVPGEISALCERLLIQAAERELGEIDAALVHAVCDPSADEGLQDDDEVWALGEDFEALAIEGEVEEALASEGEDAVGAAAATVPTDDDTTQAESPTEPSAESADAEGETTPSLEEALAYFEAAASAGEDGASGTADDVDEAPAETDAALDARIPTDEDDVDLYAMPTEAELQALRRGRWGRDVRPLAGAALAALVGGLLIALFSGEDEDARETTQISVAQGTAPIERGAESAPAVADPSPVFSPGRGYVQLDDLQDPIAPSVGTNEPDANTRAGGAGVPAATSPATEPLPAAPDPSAGDPMQDAGFW